jgi:hypothetical protein
MTKGEYIELIQEKVSGAAITADQKKATHPKVVEAYVDLAITTMCQEFLKEAEVTKEFSWLDDLAKWYDVALVGETLNKHGEIPFGLMNLPEYRAIRYFGGDMFQNSPFNAISAGRATSIFNTLDVGYADTNPDFKISGGKFLVTKFEGEKAYLLAIPRFMSLDDDEEVRFPKGNDTGVFQIVSEKILQNAQFPTERQNDSSPDRR